MIQGQANMDAIEAIKTRRCIRAYTEQSVARGIIVDVIDCGRLAATARNEQPWEFVVLTDPNQLRSIANKTDYGRFIAQAPVCILVLCKDSKYYLEDGSAATQNILVAAKAHGLGACWVAGDKKGYADEVCREIGAPKGYKLVSMVPIGHPAEQPSKAKRPLHQLVHWGKF
jgi:nitroreductase